MPGDETSSPYPQRTLRALDQTRQGGVGMRANDKGKNEKH